MTSYYNIEKIVVKPNINNLENAYAFKEHKLKDMPKARPGASPWDDHGEREG